MLRKSPKTLIVTALLLITGALTAEPTPIPFANEYSSDFTEEMWLPIKGHQLTTGKWYYSWTQKKFRVDRDNGSDDRYCGIAEGFKNTPCRQIVNEGKRYLYYPQLNYCCFCCAAENGCGIVKPDWFVTGTYEGKQTDSQYTFNTWNKKGMQSNFVSQVAGGPYNGYTYKIFQDPDSNMVFDPTSYSFALPEGVFDIPTANGANCQKTCPFLSTCTLVRRTKFFKKAAKDENGGDL